MNALGPFSADDRPSTELASGFVKLDPPSLKVHHCGHERRQDHGNVVVSVDGVQHLGGDRKLLLELGIEARQPSPVLQDEHKVADSHDDSSTGDVPAATGLTITVEVAPCRGHDSQAPAAGGAA